MFTGFAVAELCSFSTNSLQIFFTLHSKNLNHQVKKRIDRSGRLLPTQAETPIATTMVYSVYHQCASLASSFLTKTAPKPPCYIFIRWRLSVLIYMKNIKDLLAFLCILDKASFGCPYDYLPYPSDFRIISAPHH